MPPSPNPLKQPKPLDFQIAKLQNDVEALEKENSLLEQNYSQVLEENEELVEEQETESRDLKRKAQQLSSSDPGKISAQEELKAKQQLEAKALLDQLAAKKLGLQRSLEQKLRDNPHVSLSDQKQRGQVDFKLGEVQGQDRIRELETGIDEAEVRLRESKEIEETYNNLSKQIRQQEVYYEERIKRQRQELQKTSQDFENFTEVCDQAVVATEEKQAEHAQIAEYFEQNRELRRQQLENHRADVKMQLEKTAELDLREEIEVSRPVLVKSDDQEKRETNNTISILYYNKVLSLHNFKSPTEFVNACKNQAVVNDDLNDQEEAHARIKKLNEELLETQQAIQNSQYDIESAGALQKKVMTQLREEIYYIEEENRFKGELLQTQLIKLNDLKNALINTAQKLPLFKMAGDELARRLGIDQFKTEEMRVLEENPEKFDNIIYKITDVNKECEFAEAVALFRLAAFRELFEEAATVAEDTVAPEEDHNMQSAAEEQFGGDTGAAQSSEAAQNAEIAQIDGAGPSHDSVDQQSLQEVQMQQTNEFADDLYINLEDDDELPIDDLQLNEANIKIEFPRSRPGSRPPLGRGRSGKAIVIGDVPQRLHETLDRKTMKQMSLAFAEANKQPIKEE